MKKYFGAFALTVFANSVLLSQSTTVFDYSFSGDGIVTATPGPNNDGKTYDVIVQPDGKIIVGGKTPRPGSGDDFLVIRYNANGTLDNTFGTGGIVISEVSDIDDGVAHLLLQPDGKILAYGNCNSLTGQGIVRYNSDGTLDNTFGTGGFMVWDLTGVGDLQPAGDIALQNDNKIIIGATVYGQGIMNSEFALARLNPDGSIDSTYGVDGIEITVLGESFDFLSDIEIQPDGKLMWVGTMQTLTGQSYIISARFNDTGWYDGTFNGNLVIDTISSMESDYPTNIIVQPDGKILIGGTTSEQDASKYLLIRYNSNGTRDNTFGTNGVVTRNFNSESHYVSDMLLQPNGKILMMSRGFVLGGHTHFARFNANGSTDNTFNGDGHAEVDITTGGQDDMRAIAIQTDGKIVTTGFCDACTTGVATTARFVVNMVPVTIIGINDYVFTTTETLIYPNPLQAAETLKYTLAGNEKISINLIDSQGKLVAEFVKNEVRNKGENTEVLNLPVGLQNGTYFIQIGSPKGTVSIRVVK